MRRIPLNSVSQKLRQHDCEMKDLASFPEDNEESLSQKLGKLDELMESRPDLIVKPDPDLINLADELTQGNENRRYKS